ncbi:MBL fold metallo-hydrolase [Robiginitalea aurantiaca]|uniref:MBL fold metallo-hydrolase n=1 Tax=Robiginitalea aurantiaca TaxID=3056915 RepID=A0ABT7WAB0_9FLAO|nr:MBL fold metallo-hydrolase [Robiginitalea aurantiaca]MDM9629853.1 MBL fold metallo-hydrolase [Robiginitalea aurantiaca]
MKPNRIAGVIAIVFLSATSFGQGKPSAQGGSFDVELIVLGTVQDAGAPQMGCKKSCCAPLYEAPNPNLKVVSLGLLDAQSSKTYLFEATPDIAEQMAMLRKMAPFPSGVAPDGIFITHAHIGHYTGLMYLGRESMNAKSVPVYSLPRFTDFIANNGPWDQLVQLNNIELRPIREETSVALSPRLSVNALQVPHRDEYSETAAYEIVGPERKALFIPDIDKWAKWEVSLIDRVKSTDLVFIDATFYDNAEIGYRDIAEIPHPFVVESLALLEALPPTLRNRVYFIHMNHTNPLLDPDSRETTRVTDLGFRIARSGDRFKL